MKPGLNPAMPLAAVTQSLAGLREDHFAGPTNRLLGFALALLGWQIGLLLALLGGIIALGAYAGIHVGGCFVLAAGLIWRANARTNDDRYSAALQIVTWSAFAGPFGGFVATALSFAPARIHSNMPRDGGIHPAVDCSAIDRAERVHIALLDRRIRLEGACRILPLVDVIAEGSQSEKLEALAVVYRRYEARLSAVLKRALRDHDASVRVLAATVTAKLHGTYSRKIGDCQTAAVANPGFAHNWLSLAEARLAYAESGLIEPLRAREQIEFAIGDLSRAAELDSADAALAGRFHGVHQQLSAWRA